MSRPYESSNGVAHAHTHTHTHTHTPITPTLATVIMDAGYVCVVKGFRQISFVNKMARGNRWLVVEIKGACVYVCVCVCVHARTGAHVYG